MTILRSKRKIAAVLRETSEYTKNSDSQNTLDPEMAQKYIAQVFEEIEGRVTKRALKRIEPDEVTYFACFVQARRVLNPQIRTCSVAVPGTSRNNDSENREPTGDRSLNDPCTKVVFSSHHFGNQNGSELEETQHSFPRAFICS